MVVIGVSSASSFLRLLMLCAMHTRAPALCYASCKDGRLAFDGLFRVPDVDLWVLLALCRNTFMDVVWWLLPEKNSIEGREKVAEEISL